MKKLFILTVFLIGIANHIPAQVSLADLLEGKLVAKESTMAAVSEAVRPALGIIRQQYRLKRDGEYYGKNRMPYYGESYTVSVKVAGGLIFTKEVVSPWEYDADYAKVNETGKYTPVRFISELRNLSDSIYKQVDLEIGSQYTQLVNNDSLLYKQWDSKSDFGLMIDDSEGEKDGYMIWVYTNTNPQDSAMIPELKQTSMTIKACTDSTVQVVTPKNPEKVLGGIYVVPVVERMGHIQLQLVGVAAKDTDKTWKLNLLTVSSDNNRTGNKKEQKTITPIKKN